MGDIAQHVEQKPAREWSKHRKLQWRLVLLSHKVAAVAAENQLIEGIQILARGGPDESQAARE
jgi:hypothetical protein